LNLNSSSWGLAYTFPNFSLNELNSWRLVVAAAAAEAAVAAKPSARSGKRHLIMSSRFLRDRGRSRALWSVILSLWVRRHFFKFYLLLVDRDFI
jgi:hypothetical protein